jgi:phosphoribosylpyrophosphate synthetase
MKTSHPRILSSILIWPLAQEVADRVGIELGKCSVKRFSDGEIQINIEESTIIWNHNIDISC